MNDDSPTPGEVEQLILFNSLDPSGPIATALHKLDAERRQLRTKVYVPGLWRCAKCNFELIQANMDATNGVITARDAPGEKCPNCTSPLWRVTERDRHHAVRADSERWWQEAYDANMTVAAVQFALDHPPELCGTNGGVGAELGWAAAIGAYQDKLRPLLSPKTKQHSDDIAVDKFASAMKEKLKEAREIKGRGGWEKCPTDDLGDMLYAHLAKGDMRDVANFAMMIWHNEEGEKVPFIINSDALRKCVTKLRAALQALHDSYVKVCPFANLVAQQARAALESTNG